MPNAIVPDFSIPTLFVTKIHSLPLKEETQATKQHRFKVQSLLINLKGGRQVRLSALPYIPKNLHQVTLPPKAFLLKISTGEKHRYTVITVDNLAKKLKLNPLEQQLLAEAVDLKNDQSIQKALDHIQARLLLSRKSKTAPAITSSSFFQTSKRTASMAVQTFLDNKGAFMAVALMSCAGLLTIASIWQRFYRHQDPINPTKPINPADPVNDSNTTDLNITIPFVNDTFLNATLLNNTMAAIANTTSQGLTNISQLVLPNLAWCLPLAAIQQFPCLPSPIQDEVVPPQDEVLPLQDEVVPYDPMSTHDSAPDSAPVDEEVPSSINTQGEQDVPETCEDPSIPLKSDSNSENLIQFSSSDMHPAQIPLPPMHDIGSTPLFFNQSALKKDIRPNTPQIPTKTPVTNSFHIKEVSDKSLAEFIGALQDPTTQAYLVTNKTLKYEFTAPVNPANSHEDTLNRFCRAFSLPQEAQKVFLDCISFIKTSEGTLLQGRQLRLPIPAKLPPVNQCFQDEAPMSVKRVEDPKKDLATAPFEASQVIAPQGAQLHTNVSQVTQLHTNTSPVAQLHTNTLQGAQLHPHASQATQLHTNVLQVAQLHTNTSQATQLPPDASQTVLGQFIASKCEECNLPSEVAKNINQSLSFLFPHEPLCQAQP